MYKDEYLIEVLDRSPADLVVYSVTRPVEEGAETESVNRSASRGRVFRA